MPLRRCGKNAGSAALSDILGMSRRSFGQAPAHRTCRFLGARPIPPTNERELLHRWHDRDNPSMWAAGSVFLDRPDHAKKFRPVQTQLCWPAPILGAATASGFNGTACFDCLHNDLVWSAAHSISQTLTKRLAFHSSRFSFRRPQRGSLRSRLNTR
jgi:hypothetical protein